MSRGETLWFASVDTDGAAGHNSGSPHIPQKRRQSPSSCGHDTMQQFQSETLSIIDSIPFLPNLAPSGQTLVGIGILLAIAWVGNFIIKHIVRRRL
mgnify:FL=1